MPEPAVKPVDASNELDRLRQLLVGDELARLERLEARVAEPPSRTIDLAEVLPAAVRGAKAKALREALEPINEKAFSSSIRKNPKEVADAIYPIIGPAIRNSIAAAIRDFAEALNQIVEKSVSFRALSWRIESIVSGKPFTEILLARSLLYSVEQVFLIHRKSGLLLQHVAAQDAVLKDADMISGMLTAIQDFVSDSFAEEGQNLETVDIGRFKLWLTYSPKVLVVGAVAGTAPAELKQVFRKALDGVEASLQSEIDNFKQDDLTVFEPAKPFLQACLLGQSAPTKRKKARLWPYLVVVAVILIALVGWRLNTRLKWNRYFDALRHEPGIVVMDVQGSGSSWTVSGLRDPMAADPASLARTQHLDPGKVHYTWQPYLSMNTPFASRRALDTAAAAIGKQLLRFDSNSSKLGIAEADRIDDLTLAIRDLLRLRPDAKITAQGRADEVGSAAANDKLSMDRATSVVNALEAEGIPATALTAVGLGNTRPVRAGNSDWDRSTNRSVSFSVDMR